MSITEIKPLELSPTDFQIFFGEKNYIHLTLSRREVIDDASKLLLNDGILIINYQHCKVTYSGCHLVSLKPLERKLVFAYLGKVENFEEQKGNFIINTGNQDSLDGKYTNTETEKTSGYVYVQNGDIKIIPNRLIAAQKELAKAHWSACKTCQEKFQDGTELTVENVKSVLDHQYNYSD